MNPLYTYIIVFFKNCTINIGIVNVYWTIHYKNWFEVFLQKQTFENISIYVYGFSLQLSWF